MCLAWSWCLRAFACAFVDSVWGFESRSEVEWDERSFLTDGTAGLGLAVERACV